MGNCGDIQVTTKRFITQALSCIAWADSDHLWLTEWVTLSVRISAHTVVIKWHVMQQNDWGENLDTLLAGMDRYCSQVWIDSVCDIKSLFFCSANGAEIASQTQATSAEIYPKWRGAWWWRSFWQRRASVALRSWRCFLWPQLNFGTSRAATAQTKALIMTEKARVIV